MVILLLRIVYDLDLIEDGQLRLDTILSNNITMKRPGPGMFGAYKSSRRPVADLDFHEMNFLKRNAEGAQNNPLSASRARERRREDRIGEEDGERTASARRTARGPHRRGGRREDCIGEEDGERTASARRTARGPHRRGGRRDVAKKRGVQ
ncbi:hypothetical protein GGTG_04832 [Gaeumannomyces tritici R3-111a-1]|uniref:Uncharacterized protein n=1 Tax=Gaeumannomyces tritici (strain R3-111a-1) TaxID=644352 RepID=J3NU77_GAET3|nr:hypothetical protein GGTG_04832 [Gaeumannomyces tritici R3-111a-1]EJT79748.1 hypothetical protein GGTG_04832 [Gaeumannomyces tritici R3-111a-1]